MIPTINDIFRYLEKIKDYRVRIIKNRVYVCIPLERYRVAKYQWAHKSREIVLNEN